MRHTFDHLTAMSDSRGLMEHANGTTPRREHGYCTDDNARLLAVATLHPNDEAAQRLSRLGLHFVRASQTPDGLVHNRMDQMGRWTDEATAEDCWGRSVWGLGHAAVHHVEPSVRRWAQRGFDRGVRVRSPHVRAMAFAAIGAADVAIADPSHSAARALLKDAADAIGPLRDEPGWVWPEERLRYGNATLAEALIAAGAALGRHDHLTQGLAMLGWLLELETRGDHLSVVGTAGRGHTEHGPQFDQQPIEVAAMADACWRALQVTGDDHWIRGVTAAAAWFQGDNDAGLPMFDPVSHGGHDGLHATAVNLNQGAESTLAFISTMHRAAQLAQVA
jgi:hypothetical protein